MYNASVTTEKRVVILGAGELGRALEKIFTKGGPSPKTFDKDSSKDERARALGGMDFLFITTPSGAVRDVLVESKSALPKRCVVVCCSKGLEKGSALTMHEVLAQELEGTHRFAVLSGPMIAEELASGKRGGAVAASESEETLSLIADLFAGKDILIQTSKNPKAVSLLGVLKNVYALGLGISSGLGFGLNVSGILAAVALREMAGITKLLCGDSSEAYGLAGLGDFAATAFSPDSINRANGISLARSERPEKLGEGLVSLEDVLKLTGDTKDYPLLSVIGRVALEGKDARGEFEKLL